VPAGWLHEELRGKELVYAVHAMSFAGYRTPGSFEICALTQPDKADEVIRIIDKNLERAKNELVPEDELELARKMVLTTQLLSNTTNASLAQDAALNGLFGLGYDYSKGLAARLDAVTAEDVQRVARTYLTHRALVVIGPEDGEEEEGEEGETAPASAGARSDH